MNAFTSKQELAAVTHARKLYDQMYEESEIEDHDGNPLRVYRGSFSKLFETLGISKTYYRPARTLLEDSGSIVYIRGRGRTTSIIALVQPLADEAVENFSRKDLTRPEPDAMLRVVADLQDEVRRLKAWQGTLTDSEGGFNFKEALRNHESRLKKLESKK